MKTAFGFFSFTEITDPAEHRAYNEWHQLDHLPEQFPLPGIVYGQRWVSTPACRAARAVSHESLDPIHYLTCYLMAEPIESTLDDFFDLGARLHDLDRFHRHRRAHLTGPFRVADAVAAPRVLVSAEAVPFRAHRGLYVIVEEHRESDALVEYQRWLATEHEPALLAVPGVAGIWTFASSERLASPRWSAGARRITVCWLDGDLLAVAARIAPLEAQRRDRFDATSHVTFAGPFETITPWEWDWFE
ncbi:MAG: hypothetical protein QOG50_1958 [Actinomycetota bacterium]|jgi:hypothetical protein|nr:hypothetical protein [Actinomycetota bacterium]